MTPTMMPSPQRPVPHKRPSARARALAAAALGAVLAACGVQMEEQEARQGEGGPILINVTAAAAPAPGGVLALAAMPRGGDFWRGVLLASSGAGGLIAYNSDGEIVAQQDGPRYSALAAAPDFQLRGTDLPLVAALDSGAQEIAIYAFSRDQGALFLAPTEDIAPGQSPRGVCAAASGAATFDFYVLGEEGGAQLWRLRDTGETLLSAEQIAGFDSPAPGRFCTVNPDNGDLYIGAPGAGVARISAEGEILEQTRVQAADLAFGMFAGRRRLVVTQASGEVLMLDPETLEVSERTRITQGFSTPGVGAPGAVAYTGQSYGGAYPEGFLAVGDAEDGRPKFIDRAYIGRRLNEPENRYAPGPASAA